MNNWTLALILLGGFFLFIIGFVILARKSAPKDKKIKGVPQWH